MKIYALNSSVFDDESLFFEKYNMMSGYRQRKINSCKQIEDKKLSLAAGVLTDIALSQFFLRERDMRYAENEKGKPYFMEYKDIFFSLSHSGKWAVAVFSDNEVGCDIQEMKDINLNIANRFFTQNECDYINSSADKTDSFFEVWTRKESFIKALGTGLSTPLNSFDVFSDTNWHFSTYNDIAGYKISVCGKEVPGENIIICEV